MTSGFKSGLIQVALGFCQPRLILTRFSFLSYSISSKWYIETTEIKQKVSKCNEIDRFKN